MKLDFLDKFNEIMTKKPAIKRFGLLISSFYLLFVCLIIIGSLINNDSKKLIVTKKVNENKTVSLIVQNIENNNKNFWCYASSKNNISSKDVVDWVSSEENECTMTVEEGNHYVYIKNEKGKIESLTEESIKINRIFALNISKEKKYLRVSENFQVIYSLDYRGNVDKTITWTSSNNNVASINNGTIVGLNNGKTEICGQTTNNIKSCFELEVTDLIIEPTINNKKSWLKCNAFTKEQATLLDELLFYRVTNAKKGTRAGVVAAGRFLTLEFPYKLKYKAETGRLSRKNKVDGEGRYYHEGLYLSEDKFDSLIKSYKGPAIWGCNLAGSPNALDCSGFVTWVLLNGGFDPGDIGAGRTGVKDLTDLGERQPITKELIESGRVKAGDMINVPGHAAIIIGIDENNYYVAEEIRAGLTVTTVSKTKLIKGSQFTHINLMDSYYGSDGNYTSMWE